MDKSLLLQKLEAENIEGFDASSSAPKPAGNYVAVKRVGNLAYVSGQMSVHSSGKVLAGTNNIDIEFGYKAAKLAMANALKQLLYFDDINEVLSIVRVDGCFIHNNGKDIPKMLDGASDLVANILKGKSGEHARTVFGVKTLPYDAFAKVVVIAEIK